MKATLSILSLGLPLVLALSGCGTGPGPDLSGPNGAGFLSAYSGDWVLLRLESDDLDGEMREGMAARPDGRAGATGNMPGAGGRGGGMTGGGRTGGMSGGRRGGRGGMPTGGVTRDPAEMHRIIRTTRFLARTAGELTLTLRPESVRLVQGQDPPLLMNLGGDETAVLQGEVEFFAGAEWTSDGLLIERKVDGGGGVTDKIHVDEEGHLIVDREIDTGRLKVEGVLRYRKKER